MIDFDVLKKAIDTANNNAISTIVVASTTGKTARQLFELIKQGRLKMIVVTHDEGRKAEDGRFDNGIREELERVGFTIYTHDPRWILLRKITSRIFGRFGFPRWYEHLRVVKEKYGTGIKVCHIIMQMLIEGKVLDRGRMVAIAGMKSGADSAAIFTVRPQSKWPILEKVIINKA